MLKSGGFRSAGREKKQDKAVPKDQADCERRNYEQNSAAKSVAHDHHHVTGSTYFNL
jgi:hypothetical protein